MPNPGLTWAAALDRQALVAAGHDVVEFAALRRQVVEPARRSAARRDSLETPARAWIDRLERAEAVAVVGVSLRGIEDLVTLHGYVLAPALRSGTQVAIESEQRLTRLAPERFIDPGFDYPYTLERAIAAAMRLYRGAPSVPGKRGEAPDPRGELDPEQRRAVEAGEGTVQVIAPAGSGKTTVLVERSRELIRRGAVPRRILCTTFNRDARLELDERLRAAGLGTVRARTFHSIGWWLMQEAGIARSGGPRELSLGQWKRLCTLAGRETGTWTDAADARSAIGAVKLGQLLTPAELADQRRASADDGALVRVYELYEQHLAEQEIHDFDDLVLLAVRALRQNAELRHEWQGRFHHVLVDEYQDIEPAQELLVRILAAPQDELFCVGDEDQTLYGWRRASVRRIIELDLAYPGLERVSLAHNYRCPPVVVDASRRLIEHNEIRFRKPIAAGRPATDGLPLQLCEHAGQLQAAAEIVRVLAEARRGEIVVLARTTNLLRTVALACAELGVRIMAPERVFEPYGARGALEAYLRLCSAPGQALPADVTEVCRAPSRGLPLGGEEQVAGLLRAGYSFTASLHRLPANAWQRDKLDEAGRILDALAEIRDAARFVAYLRGRGGLDRHFGEHERMFAGAEQIELEILEHAQREAAGQTVLEYAALLQARSDALAAIRDDVNGIEITTIHRAKGRQWPQVHLFACEEAQLPHLQSLEVEESERAAGEGLEAERRLCYVAFTRAQQELVVHASERAASRFLTEAGLRPTHPYQPPPERLAGERSPRMPRHPAAARRPGAAAGRQSGDGVKAAVLGQARRIGLGYALRTAPSREVALGAAATALERRMVGPDTVSEGMSVAELLAAIEPLSDQERAGVLAAAAIKDPTIRVSRLGAKALARLVGALRS